MEIDAFCSSVFSESSVDGVLEVICKLKRLTELGCAYAPYRLSELFDPNSTLSQDVKTGIGSCTEASNLFAKIAFDRLRELRGADDGRAAFYLATFYQIGYPFAERSLTLYAELNEEAHRAGFTLASCNLDDTSIRSGENE